MVSLKPALIVVLAIGSICCAEDKGICPPPPFGILAPPKKPARPASPSPDKKYFGTVTFLAVISDKGYVCSTRVVRGISKEIDKKIETGVRGWHFDPALKDGHAVPAVIYLDADYWLSSAGEIVSDPPKPQSPVSSEKTENKPIH
jgi:TonB-like protein